MQTSMIESLAEDLRQELPADGLEHASAAVVETCTVQLGWTFIPAEALDPSRLASPCHGSAIALTSAGGTWLLIALSDLDSAQRLTRTLFAMDDDEDIMIEDTADALNEIMNVAAGVFKSRRDERGEKLSIGLPTFLDGDEVIYSPSDRIARRSRVISTDEGVCINVIAFWQEGADSVRLHA